MNNVVANESINNEIKLNGKEEVYKGFLPKLKVSYMKVRGTARIQFIIMRRSKKTT